MRGSSSTYGLKLLDYMSDEDDFAHRVVRKPTPEMNLAAAVLGEAIEDLSKGPGRSKESQRRFDDAREWVSDDDATHAHSFGALCHLFGLDVEATRAALLSSNRGRVDAGLRSRLMESPRPVVARLNRGRRPSWWYGDRIPK